MKIRDTKCFDAVLIAYCVFHQMFNTTQFKGLLLLHTRALLAVLKVITHLVKRIMPAVHPGQHD